MPDKFKIATVILAATLIYDTQAHHRNKKKYRKLQHDQAVNLAMLRFFQKQIVYMGSRLDEHGIAVTEFDKIIMDNIIS